MTPYEIQLNAPARETGGVKGVLDAYAVTFNKPKRIVPDTAENLKPYIVPIPLPDELK